MPAGGGAIGRRPRAEGLERTHHVLLARTLSAGLIFLGLGLADSELHHHFHGSLESAAGRVGAGL